MYNYCTSYLNLTHGYFEFPFRSLSHSHNELLFHKCFISFVCNWQNDKKKHEYCFQHNTTQHTSGLTKLVTNK